MCNQLQSFSPSGRRRKRRKRRESKARRVAWSAVDGKNESKRGSGGVLWLCADYVDAVGR